MRARRDGIPWVALVTVLAWGSAACSGTSADPNGLTPDTGVATDASAVCVPILSTGQDTGFDTCSNGVVRRRAALDCPRPATIATSTQGPPTDSCTSDADCTSEPNGYCADAHQLAGYSGCYYGCTKDADCGAGAICQCDVFLGHCVPATCTTGADCGAGLDCVYTLDASSPAVCPDRSHPTFACATSADRCLSGGDCGDTSLTPASCVLVGDHRVCGKGCI